MKKNRFIYTIMIAMAAGMAAGGCSDDAFEGIKENFEGEREITITLNLPPFSEPRTRAVLDEGIADMRVFYLNGETEISSEDLTYNENNQLIFDGSASKRKVKLKVPGGTTDLKFVANYNANKIGIQGNAMTYDLNEKKESVASGENPMAHPYLIFYGSSTLTKLKEEKSVNLYRSCAKTTFTNSVGDDKFEIIEYRFFNAPRMGLYDFTTNGTLNLPSDANLSDANLYDDAAEPEPITSEDMKTNSFYHYEAAKGNCYWIIKGKYNGHEATYYKVAYIEQQDTEQTRSGANATAVDILRNHRYDFEITDVNADGYASIGDAQEAPAENRLEVMMTNHEEYIYDMISCRDYYLGVPHEIIADATTGSETETVTKTFDVITNYPDIVTTATFNENNIIIDSSCDWIIDVEGVADTSNPEPLTTGKRYTVTLSLKPNTNSSEDRTATVTVKAGDLSREIILTQKGNDFFYGPGRWKVAINNMQDDSDLDAYKFSASEAGLPAAFNGKVDYFKMLNGADGTAGLIKGETAAEMYVDRGDGLHFSVYADALHPQYEYWIPKGNGDTATETRGGEYFDCTDSGNGYWIVKCTDEGNKNYEIWEGSLTIKTATKEVTYEIYHMGLFHKLTGALQSKNPDGEKAVGWFYYEAAEVKDTENGTGTYYILDRNIGASSNKFYSPSSTFSRENTASRGAYFHVEDIAGMGSVEALLPPGFNKLPSKFNYIKMPPRIISASDVQSGWVASKGQSWIYLPVAGAMDGDVLVDEMHAEIWSGTMVEGLQGFYPGEAEYGMWYRILDVYGTATVPTVRTRSRATNALRGIPIRAMAAPKTEAGADLPDVANSRSRIILSNDAGWDEVIIVCEGVYYTERMVKGDEDGSWYYADIKGQPTKVYFAGKSGDTNQQTDLFDVHLTENLVDRSFSNMNNHSVSSLPIVNAKFEIKWYYEYSGIYRKNIDIENLPEGSRINGEEKQGGYYVATVSGNDCTFSFSVPENKLDSKITFSLKDEYNSNEKKFINKSLQNDFTEKGGIYVLKIESM